jgi:hypothetical protein
MHIPDDRVTKLGMCGIRKKTSDWVPLRCCTILQSPLYHLIRQLIDDLSPWVVVEKLAVHWQRISCAVVIGLDRPWIFFMGELALRFDLQSLSDCYSPAACCVRLFERTTQDSVCCIAILTCSREQWFGSLHYRNRRLCREPDPLGTGLYALGTACAERELSAERSRHRWAGTGGSAQSHGPMCREPI